MKTDPLTFIFGLVLGTCLGVVVNITRPDLPGVVGVECMDGSRYLGNKVSYSPFLEDTWDIIVSSDPNELTTRSPHILVSRGCWPIIDKEKLAADVRGTK